MFRERGAPPQAARNVVRVGGLALEPGHHLGADALDIGLVEARRGEREPQQLEAFVLALGQHLQRAAHLVALRAERQFDGVVFQPRLEGAGIELAGAFVERGRRHIGDARLGLRILVGAAA